MKPKKHKLKRKKYNAKYFAILCLAFFLAGTFLFGGKIRNYAESKLVAKGNFYFNGGAYDLDKAAKYFKIAAFIDGKASYPHYQLARVYFMKTDYKSGLTEIDKALALNPENKRAFYIRGLIDGYAGNLDAAAEDFQKFIAWAPKEWAGYNDLAWVYYQDKDYQKAADAAQKGLDVFPNNAWLLNGLGVSLEAMGKNDEAKVTLNQAQTLAKNLTPADWKRAYPGNNAESAPWDLAQFRIDVNYNLRLAANPFVSAEKGKFQAACNASSVSSCSGTSCVSTPCDADVGSIDLGLPYCGLVATCADDCDCGAAPVWSPNIDPCYTAQPPSCTRNLPSLAPSCCNNDAAIVGFPGSTGSTCMTLREQAGDCFSFDDGTGWCVAQASTCGDTRWEVAEACPVGVNHAPAVAIISPSDGSTGLSHLSIGFQATVSDQDAGDVLTISSIITVKNSGNLYHDANGNISFTYGTFSYGETYTWTVSASDGKGGSDTKSVDFTIESNTPPPVGTSCQCGSISGICNGVWPSDTSGFCATGNVVLGPPSTLYGTWTWSCNANASCNTSTPVNGCSAPGKGRCGWVETNP